MDAEPERSAEVEAESAEAWYFDLPQGAWERQEEKNRQLRQNVRRNIAATPDGPFRPKPSSSPPSEYRSSWQLAKPGVETSQEREPFAFDPLVDPAPRGRSRIEGSNTSPAVPQSPPDEWESDDPLALMRAWATASPEPMELEGASGTAAQDVHAGAATAHPTDAPVAHERPRGWALRPLRAEEPLPVVEEDSRWNQMFGGQGEPGILESMRTWAQQGPVTEPETEGTAAPRVVPPEFLEPFDWEDDMSLNGPVSVVRRGNADPGAENDDPPLVPRERYLMDEHGRESPALLEAGEEAEAGTPTQPARSGLLSRLFGKRGHQDANHATGNRNASSDEHPGQWTFLDELEAVESSLGHPAIEQPSPRRGEAESSGLSSTLEGGRVELAPAPCEPASAALETAPQTLMSTAEDDRDLDQGEEPLTAVIRPERRIANNERMAGDAPDDLAGDPPPRIADGGDDPASDPWAAFLAARDAAADVQREVPAPDPFDLRPTEGSDNAPTVEPLSETGGDDVTTDDSERGWWVPGDAEPNENPGDPNAAPSERAHDLVAPSAEPERVGAASASAGVEAGTGSDEVSDPWGHVVEASGYESSSTSGVYNRHAEPHAAEEPAPVAEPASPEDDDVVGRAFDAHASAASDEPTDGTFADAATLDSPPPAADLPLPGEDSGFGTILGPDGDDLMDEVSSGPPIAHPSFVRLQGWAPQKAAAGESWVPAALPGAGVPPPADYWAPEDPDESLPPWGVRDVSEEPAETVAAAPPARGRTVIREIVETGLLALLVFLSVRASFQNFKVDGSSMYPTLENGQFLIVNKLVYAEVDVDRLSKFLPFIDPGGTPRRNVFHGPERGDIVVLEDPRDRHTDLIKRVIGLPGETLEIVNGTVYINDMKLEEPYIKAPWHYTGPKILIEPGKYFVMGDNRENSLDSRNAGIGLIDHDLVIGKAMISYWPTSKFGLAPNESPRQTDEKPHLTAQRIGE